MGYRSFEFSLLKLALECDRVLGQFLNAEHG
jgi:hypothetical protein